MKKTLIYLIATCFVMQSAGMSYLPYIAIAKPDALRGASTRTSSVSNRVKSDLKISDRDILREGHLSGISSLGIPAVGRLIDPGKFIQNNIYGKKADLYRPNISPAFPLKQTLIFLEQAGGITAETCLRGFDIGSSMDLGRGAGMEEGLKELVTPRNATKLAEVAQTIVIPSKFRARMHITTLTKEEKIKYGEDNIVYVSELHGCPANRPWIYKEPVRLKEGRAPRQQADMVAYILWNLYGIHGVKVVFDVYYPGKEGDISYGIIATKAGGMGTSGATNTLLHELGSMLSGAGLTRAECGSEAINDENTVASAYTGGQEGYVATAAAEPEDNARAVNLVWIGGIKDTQNKPKYHPHSTLGIPMLSAPKDISFIENHVAIVQMGILFAKNPDTGEIEKRAHRSSSCVNTGWMHSADTDDEGKPLDAIGAGYHRAKLDFVSDMRTGLIEHDITLINKGNMNYVGARNSLSLREAAMITGYKLEPGTHAKPERLKDYSISDRIGLATFALDDTGKRKVESETLPILEKEKQGRHIKEEDIAKLNSLAIQNLRRLAAENISLYSNHAKALFEAIKAEMADNPGLSMSAFLVGGGGDGSIITLWSSKGIEHIEGFLSRRLNIDRFNPKEIVRITTQPAEEGEILKGWMPFEVGKIGTKIKLGRMTLQQAAEKGFVIPKASPLMKWDEKTGKVMPVETPLSGTTSGQNLRNKYNTMRYIQNAILQAA
jgi:hypothetical protein